jgi:tRNA(Ile)-lysidine synthetase-like protein
LFLPVGNSAASRRDDAAPMTSLFRSFARALRAARVREAEAGRVAVALSGGPDSLALADLAAEWHARASARGGGAPEPPLALVVDHRLRPESSAEAARAAAAAERLGLRARVLAVDWRGAPPHAAAAGAAARAARYAALLAACAEEGAAHLLLGHHGGDQAETFLLRLLRASGVDGLACMPLAAPAPTYWEARVADGAGGAGGALAPGCAHTSGVRLVRPLLGARKADLTARCRAAGLEFAEDPSNADGARMRNRLRQLLWAGEGRDELCAGARDPPPLRDALALQAACAAVARARRAGADALLRRVVVRAPRALGVPPRPPPPRGRGPAPWPARLAAASDALGAARVPHAILQLPPLAGADLGAAEVALARALQAVAGAPYPPGLGSCRTLAARAAGGGLAGAFTGGGCLVQPFPRSRGRFVLVAPLVGGAAAFELAVAAARGAAGGAALGEAAAVAAAEGEEREG